MKLTWRQKIAAKIAARAISYGGSPLSNPERWLIEMFYGAPSRSGIYIDEKSAMRLATAYSCMRFLAETVGSLPLATYRQDLAGTISPAAGHYLAPFLHDQPNDFMTSSVWRETAHGHVVSWGNSYSEIVYNGAGRVAGIWPLLPWQCKPDVYQPGKLRYVVTHGSDRVYLEPEQVLHIPGLGSDGVCGYSPIQLARRSLGLAVGAEEYAARFYENDARPGVVLKHPALLNDEAYKRLKDSWNEEHQGVANSWRPRILEEGMDISTVGVPQADQQFLETRKFQVSEICRIFRVPPHFIFELDRATFANIEQQSLEFVIYNLRPWLVKWEQEMKRKLFGLGSQFFAEFNVDGLLRGDFKSRMEGYGAAIQWGLMTRNQINRLENRPPLPAEQRGDEIMVPVNMRFVTDPQPAPGAPPDGTPFGGASSRANGSEEHVYGGKPNAH
ncbi:MAG TPA: phage portal protein [Candidatus Acidoferrum sp.]|nr:phage portal protein [Candidatus Acidoferrum sp.]